MIVKRDSDGYYKISGKSYPSVTTVINVHSKPALYYFYGKHGTTRAKQIAKEASDIGTDVHSYIEKYWDEQAHVVNPEDRAFRAIKNFHTFVDRYDPKPLKNGRVVWSDKYKYAGEVDDVLFIKNKLIMIDYKTSGAVYDEYIYQAEAYCRAWNELDEHGPVRDYWIVRLSKDKPMHLTKDIYRGKIDDRVFKGFLGMLDTFNADKYIKELRRKK